MANPGVPVGELQRMLAVLEQHGGSVRAAAMSLGMPRETFDSRVRRAKLLGLKPSEAKEFDGPDDLPSELPTASELLEQRKKAFARKAAAKEARKLIPVKIKVDGPFGIAHFGDPHVDDNGTDLALLERHVGVVNKTPALFAGNVGDYQNNWIGRLAALYAQQSLSAKESWVLVEWLIRSLDWLYLVGGNHDAWSGAGDPIEWISSQGKVPYSTTGVRLGLNCPNGRIIRVNAKHDFKGHSMYNTAHGVMKAAKLGWRDHILSCGHTHVSGYGVEKCPSSGLISHCIRVASYKTYDRYAEEKNLLDQTIFVCPVTIVDPKYADDDPRLVTTIFDPSEAAEYLTWKRKKAKVA